jgi:hypothetical protein
MQRRSYPGARVKFIRESSCICLEERDSSDSRLSISSILKLNYELEIFVYIRQIDHSSLIHHFTLRWVNTLLFRRGSVVKKAGDPSSTE